MDEISEGEKKRLDEITKEMMTPEEREEALREERQRGGRETEELKLRKAEIELERQQVDLERQRLKEEKKRGKKEARGGGSAGVTTTTTGFFILIVLALYGFDILFNYSGSQFVVSFGDLLIILLKIATSGAFLFFVVLYITPKWKDVEATELVTRIVLMLFVFFVMLYGSPFGVIHLWVGLAVWWVLLRGCYNTGAGADSAFIIIAAFDIFGASFIGTLPQGTLTTALTVFAVLPVWFIVIMMSKSIPKPKFAWWIYAVMLGLIFFNYYTKLPSNPLSEYTGLDRIEELKERALGAWGGLGEFGGEILTRIKITTDKQLDYATGGYYSGTVEDNVDEPLGVYIEDVAKAEKEFYVGDKIIVWATIKARTLDDEHPVDITLSCVADEIEEGSGTYGEITPQSQFRIETLEQEDISCEFSGGLEKGPHEIKLKAEFDFTTMAYLKTYFMDKERKSALIREGIDIFDEYGIEDRSPVAIYTNGPVKIGAETTENLPLGVDSGAGQTMPRLGITLQNQWEGKIKEIKSLHIEIPDSISIVDCDYEFSGPWRGTDEGFVTYMLVEIENERLKDIESYRSINCRLRVDDPYELLGNTPLSIKYYRINTDYIYELEKPIIITVLEPEGFKSILIGCEEVCPDTDGCVCPSNCAITGEIAYGDNCGSII